MSLIDCNDPIIQLVNSARYMASVCDASVVYRVYYSVASRSVINPTRTDYSELLVQIIAAVRRHRRASRETTPRSRPRLTGDVRRVMATAPDHAHHVSR